MPVREIKTTLAVDGEKAFNKAITESGRNMRVMASEMKAAAADFNLTGDEMEYLGRKSKSLNSQIAQQEEIIRALEGAVRESAEAYGDASAKTDGYRIKLNNAQASLSKLRKELEDNDREMRDLGSDASRVGRQLEQGLGEAAEDTARKFDSMVNKLDQDIGSIKSAVSFSAFADIGGMISDGFSGVYEGVTGLVDQTMEYRRSMAFLKQNAEAAGMSFEDVQRMAIQVSGLTGDMDAAVEGMSNLLMAGLEGDELAKTVERLSGAIIQFPDTLKFESLADGLQETIATRSAVGQYAEYLERMGLDLEQVNKSLEEAGEKGQEAVETAALSWLSGHGAEEAAQSYREANAEMVAYFEAQAKLTQAQAGLAEVMTPAATAGIEMMSGFIGKLTELVSVAGKKAEEYKEAIEAGILTENEVVESAREQNLPTWDELAPGYDTGAKATGENAGKELVGGINQSIINSAPELPTWEDFAPGYETGLTEESETIGKNIATELGNGILEEGSRAITQARNLWQSISDELSRPIQGPTVGAPSTSQQATSYGGQGTLSTSVKIGLDGKTVGEGMVEYNSEAMGAQLNRASTYLY